MSGSRENLRSRQLGVGTELRGRKGLWDRMDDYRAATLRQGVTWGCERSLDSSRLLWQMAGESKKARSSPRSLGCREQQGGPGLARTP